MRPVGISAQPSIRRRLRANVVRAGSWLLPLSSITTFVVDFYHMLDLRSKARQQLLAYYFTNPTARHHLRDLAERLALIRLTCRKSWDAWSTTVYFGRK